MTTMVSIIPSEYKKQGDGMAEAMGWGTPVFVQPLSENGKEPITHYGFPSRVSKDFLELWNNPPEETKVLVSLISTDVQSGIDTKDHWDKALKQFNLQTVAVQEEQLLG